MVSWANGITLCSKHNTSRKFNIYTQDGSSNVQIISPNVWSLNQWHHVVAERYNGQITLYVNGVAEATRADTRNYAVAGTPASSAQYALSIGAQSDANYHQMVISKISVFTEVWQNTRVVLMFQNLIHQ